MKIKAQPSDLEWLCIAAERARGEARDSAQQAGGHAARQGAMYNIVTSINSKLHNIVTVYNITICQCTYTMYNIAHCVDSYCTICTILCNVALYMNYLTDITIEQY